MRVSHTVALVLLLSIVPQSNLYAAASLETQLNELGEYVARIIDRRSEEPLTNDELRTSIKAGAQWLEKAQAANGRFRYEYHPFTGTYSNDDNIVRQTGALYALGEILRRDPADPLEVERTATRAIEHFEDISQEDSLNGKTFRCVAKHAKSSQCPLGATSLALIGILSSTEHETQSTEYESLIKDYTNFILAMQKENGGFRNLYRAGDTSQSKTESPFSNGEALLALARLHQYSPDREVRKAIKAALEYLSVQPHDTALYLWMMAALKDTDAIAEDFAYTEYARDFTLWRLEQGARVSGSANNFCAYTEGVISALSVLKEHVDDVTYARILRQGNLGLRTNRALQVGDADGTRAFIDSTGLSIEALSEPERAIGGFLTGESARTQRIDYTQHCINASLQMLTDVRGSTLTKK